MEIVIKIDDERYKDIQRIAEVQLDRGRFQTAEQIIANGTPLPKGHGRLIDADVFEKRLMDARLYYIGEKADDFDLQFAAGLKSAAERLVDAPTIIEAESEGKNETTK